MVQKLSLVGPSIYIDTKGKLFEKTAGEIQPISNKYTQAEDRFVQRKLNEEVFNSEKN